MKRTVLLLCVSMLVLAAWSLRTAAVTQGDAFAATDALQAQVIAAYEAVAPAVVTVTSRGYVLDWAMSPAQRERGRGSGFVYDREGHVVTSLHVVRGADELSVTLASGRVYKAEVVGGDAASDLAVLHIDFTDGLPEPIPFANSDKLRVGQFVLAIGNPYGLERTLSMGVISALGRATASPGERHLTSEAIQSDAAIHPGNSGGPLLDLKGHLVGVNSQLVGLTQVAAGIGFATPSNTVHRVVEQILKNPGVTTGSVPGSAHTYPADGRMD